MREQARFRILCRRSSRAQSIHAHTQLHVLRTQPQLSTQTMNAMKLENVVPLPLEFDEYAEAILDVLEEEGHMTPSKLLKHLQNVCIVYAFLSVKLNAGIVSTEAKHAAAAKGYKEIAVPGFFKWLQENGVEFKIP